MTTTPGDGLQRAAVTRVPVSVADLSRLHIIGGLLRGIQARGWWYAATHFGTVVELVSEAVAIIDRITAVQP